MVRDVVSEKLGKTASALDEKKKEERNRADNHPVTSSEKLGKKLRVLLPKSRTYDILTSAKFDARVVIADMT